MSSSIAVTGGASGLGRVLADHLISHGRSVIVVDRDERAAREIGVPVVLADLSTIEGIHAVAAELTEQHEIHALVNNAGGWLPGDQYPDADAEVWLSAITLNLLAPMLLTQLLWPTLAAASGVVVNIGSSGGVGDEPYGSPEYGAAKAGLRRFTASLGSRQDVRVMAVVPGWIGLDRAQQQRASMDPAEKARAGLLIPPEDIAHTVLTLIDHGRPGEIVELLGEREPLA